MYIYIYVYTYYVYRIVCRFTVAEGELRRPTVTEGSFGFLAVVVGKEGNDSLHILFNNTEDPKNL